MLHNDPASDSPVVEGLEELCRAISSRNVAKVKELLAPRSININSYWYNLCPVHFLYDYDLSDENSKTIFDLIVNYPNVILNARRKSNSLFTPQPRDLNPPIPFESNLLHGIFNARLLEELFKTGKLDVSVTKSGSNLLAYHILYLLKKPEEKFKICRLLLENGAPVNGEIKETFELLHGKLMIDNAEQRAERDLKAKILLKCLLDLPFQPLISMHLVWIAEYADKDSLLRIYKQWDEIQWDKIWDTFFNLNWSNCLNNVKVMWTYFSKYRLPLIKEINFKPLLEKVEFQFFLEIFHQSSELLQFLDFLTTYTNLNINDILAIFDKYLDSSILRKAIHLTKIETLALSKKFLFLHILANPKLNLNNHLDFIEQDKYDIRNSRVVLLYEPWHNPLIFFCNILIYARYCTISEKILQYIETDVAEFDCYHGLKTFGEDCIRDIRSNCIRPKSLIELARNAIRFHLATIQKVEHPRHMEQIVDQLGMPEIITKILKLEKPLYEFAPDEYFEPLSRYHNKLQSYSPIYYSPRGVNEEHSIIHLFSDTHCCHRQK